MLYSSKDKKIIKAMAETRLQPRIVIKSNPGSFTIQSTAYQCPFCDDGESNDPVYNQFIFQHKKDCPVIMAQEIMGDIENAKHHEVVEGYIKFKSQPWPSHFHGIPWTVGTGKIPRFTQERTLSKKIYNQKTGRVERAKMVDRTVRVIEITKATSDKKSIGETEYILTERNLFEQMAYRGSLGEEIEIIKAMSDKKPTRLERLKKWFAEFFEPMPPESKGYQPAPPPGGRRNNPTPSPPPKNP